MQSWSLKREVALHLAVVCLVFAPFVLIHRFLGNDRLLYIVGLAIGTFLPDIDHVIYTLFLRPQELTSQRVQSKIATKDIVSAISLLFRTRDERRTLIFHTIFFQVLFVVFSLLIVSSSGSSFGRGLVCSFLLSLVVDQVMDLQQKSNVERWFFQLPFAMRIDQFKLYVFIQAILLLTLGYLL